MHSSKCTTVGRHVSDLPKSQLKMALNLISSQKIFRRTEIKYLEKSQSQTICCSALKQKNVISRDLKRFM